MSKYITMQVAVPVGLVEVQGTCTEVDNGEHDDWSGAWIPNKCWDVEVEELDALLPESVIIEDFDRRAAEKLLLQRYLDNTRGL